MADPHNPERYGELWPQYKVEAALQELWLIAQDAVLSGGMAWHFLSPEGHTEYKHLHDHRDVDIFVNPNRVAELCMDLEDNGFHKVRTRFDKVSSHEDFRRYEKEIKRPGHSSYILAIDFFVKDVPYRQIGDYKVIEPVELLKLYGKIHSSDKCIAVSAAKKLLDQGIDPQGRIELVTLPEINHA